MIDLQRKPQLRLPELTRSKRSGRAIEFLIYFPVFQSDHLAERIGIHRSTALTLLNVLSNAGLIVQLNSHYGRKGGAYVFAELLEIVEGNGEGLFLHPVCVAKST